MAQQTTNNEIDGMDENMNLMESLLERVTQYGKTSVELVKLNVVDKASDSISTLLAHSIIKATVACFVLFVNLGVAFWVGDVLGEIYYGFLAVAGFYALVAIVLHFFMHKWLKRIFYDYLIRQMLG
jgi:hypothetical protein